MEFMINSQYKKDQFPSMNEFISTLTESS